MLRQSTSWPALAGRPEEERHYDRRLGCSQGGVQPSRQVGAFLGQSALRKSFLSKSRCQSWRRDSNSYLGVRCLEWPLDLDRVWPGRAFQRDCWPGQLAGDFGDGADPEPSVSEGSQDGVVIRTPDQRLRVFVSSTLGELAAERRAVAGPSRRYG